MDSVGDRERRDGEPDTAAKRSRTALVLGGGALTGGAYGVGALRAGGPALLFAILATIAVLIVAAGLAVRLAVAAPGRPRRSGTS